jgi:ATP-dependent RNA circularization protein (DNA/RNA ligase family)
MEFNKYPKIRTLGDEENKDIFLNGEDLIYIQEKVDGANFRFYINDDGIIIFGSRTQQLNSNDGEDTNMQKNFMRCVNHIRGCLGDKDLSPYKGFIFYGECMVKHTIGYDWENTPPFLGFDIFDIKTGKFYDIDRTYVFFKGFGLDVVPIIKQVRASEIKEFTDEDVPTSKFYSGQAEGVVFKNSAKNIYAKYVRQAFKEKNRKEFGENKRHAETDEDYFTAIYCTNARIEKIVWKLTDDGNKLHLSLMPLLIKAVYKDIWEEHWNEITSTKQKTINFDKLKKAFTQRCFIVLKNIIVNNTIQQE